MAQGNGSVKSAIDFVEQRFEEFKADLVQLSRIPSISADGFPAQEVRRSAEATANVMRKWGIENVQVLEIPGVHPYVYGDWLHKPGAPTLLLYGHHDVQPPGRTETWLSPAFEAGVMAHVAAVGAYLRAGGALPCYVKFIIEGEEEIGSENLGLFLDKYKKMMTADYIVLSDTANFDTGVPALTYQLRGICQVDVEVKCLDHPLHSGMWGGPVPDPVQILCRLIADLQGKDGQLAIPGLYKDVARPKAKQQKRIRALPFDEKKFKKEGGLVEGLKLWGEKGYTSYEKMWTRPSLTVIAFEAHAIQGSSNQILDSARARLSLRTVPNVDGRKAGMLLVKKLVGKPPYGAQVTARITGTTPWWTTDPEGPAFEAARRALKAGFGKDTAMIGAGGSIGFVQPFADLLGGAPCLLMGVEDPACNAHSENESLHLGDWLKCMKSAVYLYDELSRVSPAK
jgi:acetylornithine deacetylase/succinyl-diaminopimelate desuccinylase-like protein